MSRFDRKKIAATLAFASLFGSKTSAIDTNKIKVKNPQTLGAVGGAAFSNDPNLLANSRMLKKSKSMSGLTRKIGIGAGLFTGAAVLANEGAGIFTNADALYKGKISIANGIRYLLAPKPEQRKALFDKISGVLNSFGDKELIKDKLARIVVESYKNDSENSKDPEKIKSECLDDAQEFLSLLDVDTVKKECNSEEDENNKFTTIANGYIAKSKKDGVDLLVIYGADSVTLDVELVATDDKGTKSEKIKFVYTMNKDGSLTLECIGTKNGAKIEGKAKFVPKNKALK